MLRPLEFQGGNDGTVGMVLPSWFPLALHNSKTLVKETGGVIIWRVIEVWALLKFFHTGAPLAQRKAILDAMIPHLCCMFEGGASPSCLLIKVQRLLWGFIFQLIDCERFQNICYQDLNMLNRWPTGLQIIDLVDLDLVYSNLGINFELWDKQLVADIIFIKLKNLNEAV